MNVNRAPTLPYIKSVSVNETEPVNITLVASDPDDDFPLYYYKNVSFGELDNNVFTWVPTVNDKGIYHVNFTVSDGELFDSRVVLIAVNNTNVAPQFTPIGIQNGTEGSEISFTVTATDIDSEDELTYIHSGAPSTAKISSNATAIKFTWTPDFDESGLYSVQFIVEDNLGFSDTMVVPINISNLNRAPAFNSLNPSYTINESETLTINLGANDPDTDQTVSVWINDSGNTTGTLSGDAYTWNTDYLDSGTYNMEFVVSDGVVNTSGTTSIVVNDVNAPPVLNYISSKSVTETENLQFTINATDVYDNDSLSYSAAGLPNGSTFNNISHVFSWTPADGQKGTYTIQFNVTDGTDFDNQNVSITVLESEVASKPTSSGGGGGGGGSQNTGEEFENIDFKDYAIKSVVKDRNTVFNFVKEDNSIISLSFISSLNGGQTKTIIEALKDTSSLVSGPAPGNVYKNMNIWVGDGKFVPAMVSDAKIMFKVDKVWMEENQIDPSSISLCRYSGSWDILKTTSTGEDEVYAYFIAESPGFSPFAISSVNEWDLEALDPESEKLPAVSENVEQQMSSTVDDTVPVQANAENQETKSPSIALPIIILIGVLGIIFYGYKKRDYYSKVRTQLGNPDGKRYRRIKR